AIPRLDVEQTRLYNIPGIVPNPLKFPTGCKFHPRCEFAQEKCSAEEPELKEVVSGHFVRCFFWEKVEQAKKKEAGDDK
ncbi:MAG TPA: oligopeptide/dipeptide ABC transporter ATP-binding protein, partial [Pseudothermotoga sp.]